MRKLQCLLAGSDQASLNILYEYASRLPWLSAIGKTVNGREARHYLQEFDIDILFCDAETAADKDMNSFLQNRPVKVLIMAVASANDLANANASFNDNIFCFLQMPVSFEKFFNAVSQVKTYTHSTPGKLVVQPVDFVFIKSEYRFYRVRFDEITYCEGMKDYTMVYVLNKPKPIITLQNLKTFEAKLPKNGFIRVHRSYVVSLNNIDVVSKNEITIGQKFIPIGESYRGSLFRFIQQTS